MLVERAIELTKSERDVIARGVFTSVLDPKRKRMRILRLIESQSCLVSRLY